MLVLIITSNDFASSYSNGNIPSSACEDMMPQHDFDPQPDSTSPYSISTFLNTYLPQRSIQGTDTQ